MTSIESSIVVDHVNKTYFPSPGWMKALVRSNLVEPVVALGDISFRVDPGEIVAVVGPNGAGKTTTFRILVGLTTPTKGTATVMGYNATKQSVSVRSLVGWMPGDDRSMLMRLTCSENLRFHGMLQGIRGARLERKIKDNLEIVGLGHAAQKTIFALSAGMRARIQLARALLHDPEVLILDEPTGAVDPVAAHGLLNLIMDIVRERRIAALVSSHRLEEIEALHSRVILLDRGEVRYDGDLDTMRQNLDRPCLEVHFDETGTAALAAKAIDAANVAASVHQNGAMVRFILEHGGHQGLLLAELGDFLPEVSRVTEIHRPLRDLLAEMYGGDDAETDESATDSANGDGSRKGRKRQRRQGQGNQKIRLG